MSMSQINRLCVYLIKSGVDDINSILKKNTYWSSEIDDIGTFYAEASFPKIPSWLETFFLNKVGNEINILLSSAKGVFIVKVDVGDQVRTFALTFGIGRHMLNEESFEDRFGLRVTLNSVQENSLRSIEKTSLGANSKLSREQMSKGTNAGAFGIDIEQDLVRAVTGITKPAFAFLGKTVSGADALSISTIVDVQSIHEFLKQCHDVYLRDDYTRNFDWIDQIRPIVDHGLANELYAVLVDDFNNDDFEHFGMAVPEVIDWIDLKGFKYLPYQKKDDLDFDIDIAKFKASFGEDVISIEDILSRRVSMISAETEKTKSSWSALKCFYGEIVYENDNYVLSAGKWYKISGQFKQRIEDVYQGFRLSDVVLPDYTAGREEDYIESAAKPGRIYCVMDQKNIIVDSRSKVEFCDIYSTNKDIIHVKKYGASATLSHLFQQAVVSAEFFRSSQEFRIRLNEKLPVGWRLRRPRSLVRADEYDIVLAIIGSNVGVRPHLPFFSKVGLKNAGHRLNLMGYKTSLKKINVV